MAATVTYSFGFHKNIAVPFLEDSANAVSLTGGGVAVVGDYGTRTAMAIASAGGDAVATGITLAGSESDVAQLSNGRLVIASDRGGEVYFTISRTDGTVVVPSTLADGTYPDMSNIEVAALAGGGFVIVSQAFVAGTDNDIRFVIRANNGALVNFDTIDVSTANDQNPSVAALADGGFAVAWHRRLASGAEQLWYAVYEADGTPRRAPTMLDDQGNVNRNASVVALADGGFAIAYEDTGWSGNTDIDITFARFTASGTFVDWHDISQNSVHDMSPSTTVLSNGMVVVGTTSDNGSTDTDPMWTLVDQATGTRLGWAATGWSLHYERSTSVAAMTDGQLAAFFTDNDTGAVVGEVLQATRVSVGDAAGDVLIGDDLYDDMEGRGGADTLIGGLNGDYLKGGGGADTIELHAGDVVGDFIDGGNGLDRLFVTADADLRTATALVSIEEIEFYSSPAAPVTLTIGAAQVGAGLAATLLVDGFLAGVPDTLRVVMGTDTSVSLAGFTFQDFDTGGGENDRIFISGDADAEKIVGSSLRDDVAGGGGNDILIGGAGGDALNGGDGKDLLAGGAGSDTMTGGAGFDRYDFDAVTESLPGVGVRDLITDFVGNGNLAGDLIDLATIDANVLLDGDQAFSFIGNAAFTAPGQARYANGILSLNTDGDLAAEMQVQLAGAPALVAADLVL